VKFSVGTEENPEEPQTW